MGIYPNRVGLLSDYIHSYLEFDCYRDKVGMGPVVCESNLTR
jgi:hypothetical protein